MVFVDQLATPELAPEDRHHLARVLRVRAGDAVTLADGAGRWRSAYFDDPPRPDGPVWHQRRWEPAITVAFALIKGDRPEWVVRTLTELGVDRIVVFPAARSVVRWDPDRRAKNEHRHRRVAREAAMQARRAHLPVVELADGFAEVAALAGAALAAPEGDPPSLAHPTLLVGPEGGWDDRERDAGLAQVALGEHVLRSETAAVAAGTVLAALRGGLARPSPR